MVLATKWLGRALSLNGVILTIPFRKPCNTLFDRRGRAGIRCRASDRQHRHRLPATSPGCIGKHFLDRRSGRTPSPAAKPHASDLPDGCCRYCRSSTARAAGRGIGQVAGPVRIALRRTVDQAHDRLANVIDIGEVAPHVAVVEQLDRRSPARIALAKMNIAMSGRPHGP